MNSPWEVFPSSAELQEQVSGYGDWLARESSRLETLLPCGTTGGNGAGCPSDLRARCERLMSTFCSELLGACIDHFSQENLVLHATAFDPRCRERAQSHIESHGDLMDGLVKIIYAQTPCTMVSDLRCLLRLHLVQHLETFDTDFLVPVRPEEPANPHGRWHG